MTDPAYKGMAELHARPDLAGNLSLPAALPFHSMVPILQQVTGGSFLSPNVSNGLATQAIDVAIDLLPSVFSAISQEAVTAVGPHIAEAISLALDATGIAVNVAAEVVGVIPVVGTAVKVLMLFMGIADAVWAGENSADNKKTAQSCIDRTVAVKASGPNGVLLPRDLWPSIPDGKVSVGRALEWGTELVNQHEASQLRGLAAAASNLGKTQAQVFLKGMGLSYEQALSLGNVKGLSVSTIGILKSLREAISITPDGGRALFPIYLDIIRQEILSSSTNATAAFVLFRRKMGFNWYWGAPNEGARSVQLACGDIDKRAFLAAFGAGGVMDKWFTVTSALSTYLPQGQLSLLTQEAQEAALKAYKSKPKLVAAPPPVASIKTPADLYSDEYIKYVLKTYKSPVEQVGPEKWSLSSTQKKLLLMLLGGAVASGGVYHLLKGKRRR